MTKSKFLNRSWEDVEKDYPELSHLFPDIRLYVDDGAEPGGFLKAVFSNNLSESFGRADLRNVHLIEPLIRMIYNHLPAACWGSEERVEKWITARAVERAGW